MIDSFYAKYKDLLKEAVMSENLNMLYMQIDKDKYEEYKNIIKDELVKARKQGKTYYVSDEIIERFNNLVANMDISYENDEEHISHKQL